MSSVKASASGVWQAGVRRGAVWWAAGLAAALAGLVLIQAVAVATTWGGGYWWFGAAVGTAVGALALLRARNRLLTAAAGLVLAAAAVFTADLAGLPSEPGVATALGLAVLSASALRFLPPLPAAAVAVGGAAVVGCALAVGFGAPSGLPVAKFNAVTWLAGVAAGQGLRFLDIRRAKAVARVRRAERMELARELHDVVAHHITGIVLQAQAGALDAARDPDRARRSFGDIEGAAAEALAATRRVVGLLRDPQDPSAATSPGPEPIAELAARFEARGGPRVALSAPERTWPPGVAGALHRIVQESLTNVARHAHGAEVVTIEVAEHKSGPGTRSRPGAGGRSEAGSGPEAGSGSRVTVTVTDDGSPTARRSGSTGVTGGYGLVGMRERVAALGGTLEAGPRPEGGWSVRADLPVPARPPVSGEENR